MLAGARSRLHPPQCLRRWHPAPSALLSRVPYPRSRPQNLRLQMKQQRTNMERESMTLEDASRILNLPKNPHARVSTVRASTPTLPASAMPSVPGLVLAHHAAVAALIAAPPYHARTPSAPALPGPLPVAPAPLALAPAPPAPRGIQPRHQAQQAVLPDAQATPGRRESNRGRGGGPG